MKITIKKNRSGSFNVYTLGKFADSLGYDEMLGLISSLTMPEPRPCMRYLWDKEEKKVWEERFRNKKPKEVKQPLLLDKDYGALASTTSLRHHLLHDGKISCFKCGINGEWSIKDQQFKCPKCNNKTNFPLGFIIELRRKHNLPTEPDIKSGFTRQVVTVERVKQLAKQKAPLLVTEWLDGETLCSSLFVACLNPATLDRLLRNNSIFEFNPL